TGGEPAVFDDEHQSLFPPGLIEALKAFRPGTKAIVTVPPALGYRDQRSPYREIRPEMSLRYEVTGVAIKRSSLGKILWQQIETGGMMAATECWEKQRRLGLSELYVSLTDLDYLGRGLLYHLNRPADAITVLKWNVELYPTVLDAEAALAEAYFV